MTHSDPLIDEIEASVRNAETSETSTDESSYSMTDVSQMSQEELIAKLQAEAPKAVIQVGKMAVDHFGLGKVLLGGATILGIAGATAVLTSESQTIQRAMQKMASNSKS